MIPSLCCSRFGVYDVLKAKIRPTIIYRKGKQEKVIPVWKIATVASVAGAAGGLAGNPAGEFAHFSFGGVQVMLIN